MAEHRWTLPEHQDVPSYAAESLSLDTIGSPAAVDPPQPVTVHHLRFDQIGILDQVKAFAVVRSNVAVYVEIAWQGRLQRAWVRRDTVTTRVPNRGRTDGSRASRPLRPRTRLLPSRGRTRRPSGRPPHTRLGARLGAVLGPTPRG